MDCKSISKLWRIANPPQLNPIGSLNGHKALSPEHRSGYARRVTYALKGQKRHFLMRLLPFQGDYCASLYPGHLPELAACCPFGSLLDNCG